MIGYGQVKMVIEKGGEYGRQKEFAQRDDRRGAGVHAEKQHQFQESRRASVPGAEPDAGGYAVVAGRQGRNVHPLGPVFYTGPG